MIMGYVLVIALYIIYRRRLAKQKSLLKQQLALEQQRNKITADLHDDIGATLSSLQINSAVANRLMTKNPQEAQLILEKIENQSQNIADKIGDIIWSMKPGKDEFMTISTRIKNFANDILGATSIAYEVIINPLLDVQIKDISTRKNIILITKEAINNTVKYSQATTILITLSIEQNAIALQIKDNGIGFDTSQVKGNGMANMRKRVEELNGEFSINSSTNKGTTIKAVIPFIP
jgi:signal transduction histidine kinase